MAVPIKDGTAPSDQYPTVNGSLGSTLSYMGDDNPSRNGYPPAMFEEEIAQEYFCNLCFIVLCKPMATDCGCRFCTLCIHQYISGAGDAVRLKCPGCDDFLEIVNLHVDSFAKKHLMRKRITCENKEFGCPETFRLDFLGEHLEKCQYTAVVCTNGCGAKLLPSDVGQHLTKDCPQRILACDYCGQSFRPKELEKHAQMCRENLIPCPNKCNSIGIHQDRMNHHLEKDCPEEPMRCIFEALGCTYECRRKELDKHLRTNTETHYSKLGGEVVKMKTGLSDMQLHLDQMRSNVNQAANNPEMSADVNKLSEMMKKLQMTMVQKFDKIGKLEKASEQTAKKSDVQTQASRVDTLASQTTSLSNRVQKLEEKAGQGPRGRRAGGTSQQPLEQRVSTLENQISLHAMRLAEHDVRFQVHGTTSYNGTLVWKIKEYARRKRDADSGKTLSLYSQPFFSSRYGFKMCARVYLNGDGIGKGTHMSLFFVIMKGDYDALLTWPFKQKVTLMLLDQENGVRHLSDSFRPDPTSSSFQRPTAEMNIASGCPLFVSQDVLRNTAYLRDDTIFLKIVVETDDLQLL